MNYFQDQITKNHCYGCGPQNKEGLNIKSYWDEDGISLCNFTPQAHHCAGPTKFLNGGIIATVIDCHCICTAMAHDSKNSGIQLSSGDHNWYATESIFVKYKRPVSIDAELTLKAHIENEDDRRIYLSCTLESDGKICATADVIAISVPSSWMA